jgi:two-component system NarL family sensor kinase
MDGPLCDGRSLWDKPSPARRDMVEIKSRVVTEHHVLVDTIARISTELMTAEAEERRRIARELHDSVSQHLVAMDLLLSQAERSRGAPAFEHGTADIREALREAQREVRAFSYLLHPPDLERLGLPAALSKLATGFGARTGLAIRLQIDEVPTTLSSAGALAVFRTAQEALMNVHRHAQANTVNVTLNALENQVLLEISDNGVGLEGEALRSVLSDGAGGVGIVGMRARLEALGGSVEFDTPERGLRIRAKVPVNS